MGKAPCCEKTGLRKGPWTIEEDQRLVAYIQRHGHGIWRALPKRAGLLRCGKSCRLRWINYLRPDIKRGNFTKEEEDAVITLQGILGNRWSAIAARLPGRTDNEIKNIWHTYLKKRVSRDRSHAAHDSKRKAEIISSTKMGFKPKTVEANPNSALSSSNTLSCISTVETDNNGRSIREAYMGSSQEFAGIDDSFWSETLSMDVPCTMVDCTAMGAPPASAAASASLSFSPANEDGVSFWLGLLREAVGWL